MYKIIDGHLILDGLTVGDLCLPGCTGLTTLPAGLTVGGFLNLSGTGVPHFLEHRGFKAYHHEGRIYAGCHNFTIGEALAYWGKDPVIVAALLAIA